MKNVSNKITVQLIFLTILAIAFSSCSRTQFRSLAEAPKSFATQPAIEIPIDPEPVIDPLPIVETPTPQPPPPVVVQPLPPPPVIPEPPIVPQPVQKSGVCKADSSTQLLTCMNCLVPMNPPAKPQLSEKGKALIEIMAIGCSVPNKSAPKNYVPPTKDELLTRLNRLSPTLYPDTVMNEGQKNVVSGLKSDPRLQQKMFGGVWYQPPYSDYLETYFGISTSEAVYNLCYSDTSFTPTSAQPLMSKEYLDCTYNGNNCREKPDYIAANKYRDQLNFAMHESVRNPYVAPAPGPAKKCTWENFEGDYDLGGQAVVERWLKNQFKVGMEIGSLAGKCEMVQTLPAGSNKPRGFVKMAAYTCK